MRLLLSVSLTKSGPEPHAHGRHCDDDAGKLHALKGARAVWERANGEGSSHRYLASLLPTSPPSALKLWISDGIECCFLC